MSEKTASSRLQEAIETVEALPHRRRFGTGGGRSLNRVAGRPRRAWAYLRVMLLAVSGLALPFSGRMTEGQVERVCQALAEVIGE